MRKSGNGELRIEMYDATVSDIQGLIRILSMYVPQESLVGMVSATSASSSCSSSSKPSSSTNALPGVGITSVSDRNTTEDRYGLQIFMRDDSPRTPYQYNLEPDDLEQHGEFVSMALGSWCCLQNRLDIDKSMFHVYRGVPRQLLYVLCSVTSATVAVAHSDRASNSVKSHWSDLAIASYRKARESVEECLDEPSVLQASTMIGLVSCAFHHKENRRMRTYAFMAVECARALIERDPYNVEHSTLWMRCMIMDFWMNAWSAEPRYLTDIQYSVTLLDRRTPPSEYSKGNPESARYRTMIWHSAKLVWMARSTMQSPETVAPAITMAQVLAMYESKLNDWLHNLDEGWRNVGEAGISPSSSDFLSVTGIKVRYHATKLWVYYRQFLVATEHKGLDQQVLIRAYDATNEFLTLIQQLIEKGFECFVPGWALWPVYRLAITAHNYADPQHKDAARKVVTMVLYIFKQTAEYKYDLYQAKLLAEAMQSEINWFVEIPKDEILRDEESSLPSRQPMSYKFHVFKFK